MTRSLTQLVEARFTEAELTARGSVSASVTHRDLDKEVVDR